MACSNSADALVSSQITSLATEASAAIDSANEAIEELGSSAIGYTGLGLATILDPNIVHETTSTPIVGPAETAPEFSTEAPNLEGVPSVSPGAVPTFSESAPVFYKPTAPSVPKNGPNAPYIDTSLQVPDAPVLDIAAPSLIGITVPTVVPLVIPDFDPSCAPDCLGPDVPADIGEFDFTEIDYTSDVLDQVDAMVQQMIAGGVGIPDNIWNTIWEKRRDKLSDAGSTLVSQINTEWAARGFSLPQGVQVAQIQQAREKIYTEVAEFNREIAIKYAEDEVKNLQFAVQQGIAFESLRGGWHEQQMQRALQAAMAAQEMAITLFSAEIGLYNAKIAMFNAEASVYKITVDAQVAKLQATKLEIEAAALINDVNLTTAQIYKTEVETVAVETQIYKTQVDAAVAGLESAKIEVELYAKKITKYSAEVEAAVSQYTKYKSDIDFEGLKSNSYQTAAQLFSADVDAYKANAQAQSLNAAAIVDNNKNIVAGHNSTISAYSANVEAKIGLLAQHNDEIKAEADMFSAKISDTKAASETEIRSYYGAVQRYAQDVEKLIANASNRNQRHRAEADLNTQASTSVATTYAGLAGSITAAMHVSAGIGDTISCSGS